MKVHLRVWRQESPKAKGELVEFPPLEVSEDASFLEMMDALNERMIAKGQRPIEFESDCREGICGTCGLMINGQAHGPELGVATCQLHMRSFSDGDVITIEPWRAGPFPVIRDLVVDRSAYDEIISAGGYVSVKTGPQPDANAMPIPKPVADAAFNAAACIGCGACAAACPNSSPSLFVGAKISHLALLPQGVPERTRRVHRMVSKMDELGFGHCTNIGECAAACPVNIPLQVIGKMKREYIRSALLPEDAM